jgi:imidazole glycerol-phosphate synthase subunit HisF
MSLARRIIPCLDTDGARVVKGVHFEGLRDAGDPVELAERYNAEGADELVVLDIAAARDNRPTFLETIRRVAEQLAIPLTAGGGIRSLEDARGVVRATPLNAQEWAQQGVEIGAGEILLTSVDRDGTQSGFDLELTAAISETVSVPVIASGGAKLPAHFLEIFMRGAADAALAASIFHDQMQSIRVLKEYLRKHGVEVRLPC